MTVSTETDGRLDSAGVRGLAEENELLMSELNQATNQLVGPIRPSSVPTHSLPTPASPIVLHADADIDSPGRPSVQMGRSMAGVDVGHASRGGLVGKRFPRELGVSRP